MKLRRAFTIVEIAAVISVLAVISAITIVGYGSWRNRAAVNDVKNELTLAAAAMKAELTTNNAYPSGVSSSYRGGSNVTISYISGDGSSYCLEGVSKTITSIRMFIKDTDLTPSMGTCGSGSIASLDPNTGSGGTSNVIWTDVSPWIGNICGTSYSGNLYCWGNGVGRPALKSLGNAMSGAKPVSVSVGWDHTCVIGSDSNAYCYGTNTYGQLGDGTTTTSATMVPVSRSGALTGLTVKKVSAGPYRTCAIASDSQVYCWGNGNLGAASPTQSSIPVKVNISGKTVSDVSVGNNATCVITTDGLAYCWGFANGRGQLGIGTNTNSATPVAVSTSGALAGVRLKSISAGNDNWCALDDQGRAYCWGWNSVGQLGDGTTTDRYTPVQVSMVGALTGKTLKRISTYSTTCAIASDDMLYCWGDGSNGRLGNGGTANSIVPVAVDMTAMSGQSAITINSRGGNICAISNSQRTYCWGTGPLGDGRIGANANSAIPVLVIEP